jgi:hypothetical protein
MEKAQKPSNSVCYLACIHAIFVSVAVYGKDGKLTNLRSKTTKEISDNQNKRNKINGSRTYAVKQKILACLV